MKEDKDLIEKFIKINPFDFKNSIISNCRQMDKVDVYEWIANDELKIHQLETNWKELKKWLEDNIEHVEWTSLSEDYLTGFEDVLNKIQELESE